MLGFIAGAILTFATPPARANELLHGHDCATASRIGANAETRSLLSNSNDIAVYRVVIEQRGLFDVWTDPGSFDVWDMDLLDAKCEAVPGVSGGVSSLTGKYSKITVPSINPIRLESVWTMEPGTYFIRLHPAPVLAKGAPFIFHTRFTPHFGHECSTAEALPPSRFVESAMLYDEDREVFAITLQGRSEIRAWTTGPLEGAKAPVLSLHLADCSRAFLQEYQDGTGMITTPLPAGTYYIAVQPAKPDLLGPYRLHIEY